MLETFTETERTLFGAYCFFPYICKFLLFFSYVLSHSFTVTGHILDNLGQEQIFGFLHYNTILNQCLQFL